jgi:O-antigen ligase
VKKEFLLMKTGNSFGGKGCPLLCFNASRYVIIVSYILLFVVFRFSLRDVSQELNRSNYLFLVCVLIMVVPALVLFIRRKQLFRLSLVDYLIVVLILWMLLCSLVAGGGFPQARFCTAVVYLLFYISLRVLFTAERRWSRVLLLIIMLFVCFSEAYIGIMQMLGQRTSHHGLFPLTGSFFNPGPYGGYLAVIGSVALAYVFMYYRNFEKIIDEFRLRKGIKLWKALFITVFIFALVSLIAAGLILPSTMSRAALLGIALSTLIMLIRMPVVRVWITDYFHTNKKRAISFSVLSLLVLSGLLTGGYLLKPSSANGRMFINKMSLGIMVAHPLFGVGPGNFAGEYGRQQSAYFRQQAQELDFGKIMSQNIPDQHLDFREKRMRKEVQIAGCPQYGFNEYFQWGVETGFVGLLLLLTVILTACIRLLRQNTIFAYGLITLSVFALFSYPFSLLPFRVLLVVLLALAGSGRESRVFKYPNQIGKTQHYLVLSFWTVCLGVVLYFSIEYKKTIEATMTWNNIKTWYSCEYYDAVLENYPELFEKLSDNPVYLFEYGRSLNQLGHYEQSIDLLKSGTKYSSDPMFYNIMGNNYKALHNYREAEAAYLTAYYMLPNRLYPLYLLTKLYDEQGDHKKFADMANIVLNFTPKVESINTEKLKKEIQLRIKAMDERKVKKDNHNEY